MSGRCLYPSMQDDLDDKEFPEAFDLDVDEPLEELRGKSENIESPYFPPEHNVLAANDDSIDDEWMLDVDEDEEFEQAFEDDRLLDPLHHGFPRK